MCIRDSGYSVKLKMTSDATAAIGMVRRQGLGAVRHLATSDLWIQQRVKSKEIVISKVGSNENPGDVFTKTLSAEQTKYLLNKLGFEFMQGRATVAPIRADIDDHHLEVDCETAAHDE